jgi:hypothetical protein
LVLAISTSVGSAAEPPCFELYPNSNASGLEGAILLNKCTGQTWLLVGVNTGSGNSIGWHPIPIDMSPDDSPTTPKSEDRPKTDTDAAYAD